jgi:hypothetical protein
MRYAPNLSMAIAVIGYAAPAAAAITLEELQGAQIEATIVYDQVLDFQGRTSSRQIRNDWQISIGQGGSLRTSMVPTQVNPSTRTFPTMSGSFTLGTSRSVTSLGGGEGLWTFEGGQLIFLRTYREGAYRLIITLGSGSTCSIHGNFGRENGVGAIEYESQVGGSMKIRSSKQISSSCRVTKH